MPNSGNGALFPLPPKSSSYSNLASSPTDAFMKSRHARIQPRIMLCRWAPGLLCLLSLLRVPWPSSVSRTLALLRVQASCPLGQSLCVCVIAHSQDNLQITLETDKIGGWLCVLTHRPRVWAEAPPRPFPLKVPPSSSNKDPIPPSHHPRVWPRPCP